MTLAPCPRCKRHVATSEPACPFCGAATSQARAQHVTLVGRVSRAAVFSAALVACSNEKPAPLPAPPAAQGSGSGSDDLEQLLDHDEGTVAHPNAPAPLDAAAAPDAAIADAGVPDAGRPDAGVVSKKKKKKQQQLEEPVKTIEIDRMQNAKPYGAPPMRRRVV